MATSAFLRSLISNPTKITSKFVLKPSQFLLTRPFSSSESNPISPNPNSDPPISPDPVTQITTISPYCKKPTAPEAVAMNEMKLVEEYFKARTDGLFGSAASNVLGRSSRRLRLLQKSKNITETNQVTDSSTKSHDKTPDVVAHIAVLEAYANAGQTHHSAYTAYLKMLGPGVIPNEFTYNKLIELLASTSNGDSMMMGQAQKYLKEMLEKGMKPAAPTSVAVFKALAKEGRVREGKELLEDIKAIGFEIDDKVFKVVLKGGKDPVRLLQGKEGRVIKTMLEMLFDKKL